MCRVAGLWLWGIDPSACTIWSLILTNHRHEMLLFLAQIYFLSQTAAGHTLTQCSFAIFGSVTVSQQNGSKGAPRVIDLEKFPVQISKALTPLPAAGILFCLIFLFSFFFFFFYFCHSPSPPPPPPPHLPSLYSHVRFMVFQSVFFGTTIIRNNKRSLLGQYSTIL